MADVLTVENDSTSLSVEDAYNQEMAQKADGAELIHDQGQPVDKPEDKFGGDYAKLKASYEALEQRMHSPDVPVDVQEDLGIPQDPQVAKGAFDIGELTKEYTANGSLSDKSYKQLEDGGVSRELADSYIAGQKALGEQIGNNVKNEVGGSENYQNMVEWAKANYSPDQVAAYDSAVNSGNVEMAKMAARGLQADYQNKAGVEGNTYGGKQATPEGGDVFRSNGEVTAAMKDPRYENDSAYRNDVLRKLDRSDIFSQGKL